MGDDDLVDEVPEPGAVEGHRERNPDPAALHHLDLLDELQDDLALALEGQVVEPVGEHLREPTQLRDVALERLPEEVLLADEVRLALELLLLRRQLGDLRAAGGGVEALADGVEVVLDAPVDVAELLLERAGVGAELAAEGVDPTADLVLELRQALGLAEPRPDELEDGAQCFGIGSDAQTAVPLLR